MSGIYLKVSKRESFVSCASMIDHIMSDCPAEYITMGLRLFQTALNESELKDRKLLAFEWAQSSSLVETQDVKKMLLKLFSEEESPVYKFLNTVANIDNASALAYYFDLREQELKQNLVGEDISAASHEG